MRSLPRILIVSFALLIAAFAALDAGPVRAAATVCPSGCTDSTIQAAVNTASPGDTISVAAGTYHEHVSIVKTVTINGAGVGSTIVDGSNSGTVFFMDTTSPFSVTLSGMTVQNGSDFGGIYNANATLTLSNVAVKNNTNADTINALFGFAGGITNDQGNATLTNVTVTGNSTPAAGGGIFNGSGQLNLSNVTLSGNAGADGGGLYTSGPAVLTNVTVSGNTASSQGGGIAAEGANQSLMVLRNATISGNTANGFGGGMIIFGDTTGVGRVFMYESTVSGNQSPNTGGVYAGTDSVYIVGSDIFASNGTNCFASAAALSEVSSEGYNISDDASCGLTSSGDLQNANPQLGPLANYGGPVQTMGLYPNSPAIDHVPFNNNCNAIFNVQQPAVPVTDARGVPRNADGRGCDSGAFESFLRTTSTTLTGCNPSPTAILQTTTCTVVVNDIDTSTVLPAGAPAGSVRFSSSSGSFSAATGSTFSAGPPPACTLSIPETQYALACQVTFTPFVSGAQKITATYNSTDFVHATSTSNSSSTLFTILPNLTVLPTDGTATAPVRGVACPSANFCAAGGTGTGVGAFGFVDQFNGTSWGRAFTQPSNINVLDAVSCTGLSFCVAVGDAGQDSPIAVIDQYNGASWTVVTHPTGFLNGVACATPTFCVAVGGASGSGGMILQYNGTSWTSVSSVPTSAFVLLGVSCPTTTFCVASGETGNSAGVLFQYNGSSWTNVSGLPTAGALSSVACPTTTFCAAVGQGVILQYNGSSWSSVGNTSLQSVACAGPSFCVAVGPEGVILYYDGTGWTSVDINPSTLVMLSAGCASPGPCVAIGEDGSTGSGQSVVVDASVTPAITSIAPASVTAGASTSVNINGTNFFSGSLVQLFAPSDSTTNLVPSSISSTSLTVTLPGLTPGAYQVDVANPGSGSNLWPLFVTQSGTSVTSETTSSSGSATSGGVTASGSGGTGTITVAQYSGNPGSDTGLLQAGSTFYDVNLTPGGSFTSLAITLCGAGSGTQLLWYNTATSAWAAVSPAAVATTTCSGGLVFTASATSSPTLAQLTGTPFVAGIPGTPGSPFLPQPLPPPSATPTPAPTATTGPAGSPTPTSTPGCATVSVAAGWNLAGGPTGMVLRGALGSLYTYQAADTSYESFPTSVALSGGVGVWAYFSAPATLTLPCVTAQPQRVALPAGHFIMVGNPTDGTVNLSGADVVYVYNTATGQYAQATTLPPGQGAWVFSRAGGTLTITST